MTDLFSDDLDERLQLALNGTSSCLFEPHLVKTVVDRARSRAAAGIARRATDGRTFVDAEALLDLLESAAGDSPSTTIKSRWGALMLGDPGDDHVLNAPDVAMACRKYIAACCEALICTSGELAAPYRRWARIIGTDDTIVTFNYDRVVETMAKVTVVRPKQHVENLYRPFLLKLHGSTNWVEKSDDLGDPWSIISDPTASPFLVAPGPGKGDASSGMLRHLWETASDAITGADVVVFIGYRFAQGDAHARLQIADALRANKQGGLVVRVVLGPQRSDDVERTMGLARWSTRRDGFPEGHVIHEPMWAEDFLSVFDRGRLDDVS